MNRFTRPSFRPVSTLSLLLALSGCAFETIKDVKTPDSEEDTTIIEPTFASIDEKILQRRCVSCHDGATGFGGVELDSYAALISSEVVTAGDPEASLLYTEVESGEMPQNAPGLSSQEIEAIAEWIRNGAIE